MHGSGRLDVRAPDSLCTVNMAGEAAGEKAAVHRGADELVVFVGVAGSAKTVAAALAAGVDVAGVVRLAVERRRGVGGVVNIRQIPIDVVLALVADGLQRHP